MELQEIYAWLMDTDPVADNVEIRMVWANMASYCYFVNTLDFDTEYREKLTSVLQKSVKFGIKIPDQNHQKVLDIAKSMNDRHEHANIKSLLHG